ncbi:Charged multivesicular body protein 6 [Collichthys lucidus]|uniref:Charged multivesicular body protein 6 n=1 Tax=Collichthys lucidus TaxID=240159 RepID=A0A4U5VTF0_COLLU|nr:Charged multivesicular body protein 6 [Collichthys lucidus]
MGNVFGRKSRPSRVTEQDKAILQLKQQRDKLKLYQKKITLQLEKERLLAKQLLKDGKKVQDIEFMQIEMKVIEGLKVGNDCLRSMHEIMSVEDVERILDETQESIEYQRQIDEMLAGALTQEDEDAVLAELEAITQGDDVALPEVPTEPIPEVPEAAKAEPERREAKNKPDREMLAA